MATLQPTGKFRYCCRKCGFELFQTDDVIHDNKARLERCRDEGIGTAGNNEIAKKGFSKRRDDRGYLIRDTNCTSVFIGAPKNWMNIEARKEDDDLGDEAENSGKLACPKCSSKLGSYSWSGQQCSCVEWITPAFQFNLSHIDPKPIFLS